MLLGDGTVNVKAVIRIVAVTLGIAIAIDLVSNAVGWRIPWYTSTAVITLFMYACDSTTSYKDREAFSAWKDEIESRLDRA
jgi:hypothetical protein